MKVPSSILHPCSMNPALANGQCGSYCSCPKWSQDCVDVLNSSIAIIGDKDKMLRLASPSVCSYLADPKCSLELVHTTFSQI